MSHFFSVPKVEIHCITPTDADSWLRLRRALWPECSESEHRREIDHYFSGRAPEPEAVFLAVDQSGDSLGFAELSIRACAEGCRTNRVAYLEGWYVIPGARRQGVGRALVEAGEKWGRIQGCKELASDTQLNNETSRLAHDRLGFEDVGLVRCFRKDL